MANPRELLITPTSAPTSRKELFYAGTLFCELADMVAGFAAENTEQMNEEHLTAITFVTETMNLTGAQFIELATAEGE